MKVEAEEAPVGSAMLVVAIPVKVRGALLCPKLIG